jgi:redox-sensitive bicupin YhaK (pirin superfamily)
MLKDTRVNSGGRNESVGGLLLNRLLPNDQLMRVGPFVFLGHVYPIMYQRREPKPYRGHHAHPNRGFIIVSYVLSGAMQYVDSQHHSGVISSGGVLWRNTGNGIIHDEWPSANFIREGGIFHLVRFWINLPGIYKQESPAHWTLAAGDIPEVELPDNAGVLKVLLGSFGVLQSPLKTFLSEYVIHICINPKSFFSYTIMQDMECAAFVPTEDIRINDQIIGKSHLLVFSKDDSTIQLYNPGISIANVFIFGGREYLEPIVAQGPFVLNSRSEIAEAYGDFFAGRYGELSREIF